jgi:signal transduction histidine kinase
MAWFATGLLAQGYRYHRVSDLVERQQTKWTLLGLAAAVTGGVLYYGLLALAQDDRWTGDLAFLSYTLARPALQTLFMACLPICLVIAIMRYHLFDIDLILNRALVYGALTGLVIAIYVVVVGALSAVFGREGSLLFSLVATGLVAVADQRLLSDVARQAGVVAHAVQLQRDLQHLAGDLQQARERLVATREEERRRLRRDLHDGLGPSLASLTFKLDAARSLLARDPARADALLSTVADQMQSTVAEIRRLVYNLRPPALDQLGLAAALAESAGQVGDVPVVVDLPPNLPPLPAAVEVAAYRIAQEALTNVARHAHAQNCWLHLRLDGDWLALEVRDDGRGLPADMRNGVGLHAMQERAAELGGVCTVASGPAGTVVLARLPLYETG